MQLSLPFIDIIIFAIIAIFLVYRLKNILGQTLMAMSKIIKLILVKKFSNAVKLGNKQSDINEYKSNKDTIYKEDPTFNEKSFKRSSKLFEMV